MDEQNQQPIKYRGLYLFPQIGYRRSRYIIIRWDPASYYRLHATNAVSGTGASEKAIEAAKIWIDNNMGWIERFIVKESE